MKKEIKKSGEERWTLSDTVAMLYGVCFVVFILLIIWVSHTNNKISLMNDIQESRMDTVKAEINKITDNGQEIIACYGCKCLLRKCESFSKTFTSLVYIVIQVNTYSSTAFRSNFWGLKKWNF